MVVWAKEAAYQWQPFQRTIVGSQSTTGIMSNKNPTTYARATRSPSDVPSTGSAENAPTSAARVGDDDDDAIFARSFAMMPRGRVEEINDDDEPPNPFHKESSASVSNSNKLWLTSSKGKTLMTGKLVSGEEELSSRRLKGSGGKSIDPSGLGTSNLTDYPSSEAAYSIAGRQPTLFPVKATLFTDDGNTNHRPPVAILVTSTPPSQSSQSSASEVGQQPTEDSWSSVASYDAVCDSNHANEVDEQDLQVELGVDWGVVSFWELSLSMENQWWRDDFIMTCHI